MRSRSSLDYSDLLERSIDKFLIILIDVIVLALITAIIAILSWEFLTEAAKWVERY
jgi:hypothetical protein